MFEICTAFIVLFVWLFLNSVLAFYFASNIMSLRYSWKKTAMLIIIVNIFVFFIYGMFHQLIEWVMDVNYPLYSIINYLFTFMISMLVFKFFFTAQWKWRMMFVLFDMGISFLISQLSMLLSRLIFIKDGFMYGDLQILYIVESIADVLLYIPIMYIVVLFWKARKDAYLRRSDVFMIALPPLTLIIAVYCISVPLEVYKEPNIYLFLSLFLLLISDLMTCYIYPKLMKKNQLEFDNQQLQDRIKQDTQYYQMMQEKYDEQRSLRHDVTKHLRMIQTMLQEHEYTPATKYIAQYIQHYECQRMYHSGYHLLDSILNSYADQLQKAAIQIDLTSCESINFPMNSIDTSIVFGNIIENAIASCEQSHEKYIQIICRNMQRHMVMFEVINSCDQVNKEGDKFVSTKQNGGYGLMNIRNTVEKNQGNVTFHYKEQDHMFYSIVHFHSGGMIYEA